MPIHDTVQGQSHEVAPRKRSSTAAKLVQAAALAAVLVPLGSISSAEAASITCTFSGSESDGGQGGSGCFGGGSSLTYDFGDYTFQLTFDLDVNANFDVTVNTTTNIALDGSLAGYECIQLTATDGCVDFQVLPQNASSGSEWTHYEVTIDWVSWASPQTLTVSQMRMLHDSSEFDGAEAPGTYDFDMCVTAGYDSCFAETEPQIRSGDTDFDSFTAALAVPEPSSLMLFGVGIAALARRRRQMSR